MATSSPHRYDFTFEEFERLHEIGFFTEDDRVELIDGEIVQMAALGIAHVECVDALSEILFAALRGKAVVSGQNAIRLGRSAPQPDLHVRRRRSRYDRLPEPADVFLVVEVADSSLDYDRRTKLPRYAAAGIVEAWLVNINGQLVERHTEPDDARYGLVVVGKRGDTLTSTVFPSP